MKLSEDLTALSQAVGFSVIEESRFAPNPKTYEIVNVGGGAVELHEETVAKS